MERIAVNIARKLAALRYFHSVMGSINILAKCGTGHKKRTSLKIMSSGPLSEVNNGNGNGFNNILQ